MGIHSQPSFAGQPSPYNMGRKPSLLFLILQCRSDRGWKCLTLTFRGSTSSISVVSTLHACTVVSFIINSIFESKYCTKVLWWQWDKSKMYIYFFYLQLFKVNTQDQTPVKYRLWLNKRITAQCNRSKSFPSSFVCNLTT